MARLIHNIVRALLSRDDGHRDPPPEIATSGSRILELKRHTQDGGEARPFQASLLFVPEIPGAEKEQGCVKALC